MDRKYVLAQLGYESCFHLLMDVWLSPPGLEKRLAFAHASRDFAQSTDHEPIRPVKSIESIRYHYGSNSF